MRVVSKGPDPSVTETVICKGCGATIEYVPNDVKTLWSGTDYGGGADGARGFKCPECSKDVILERW